MILLELHLSISISISSGETLSEHAMKFQITTTHLCKQNQSGNQVQIIFLTLKSGYILSNESSLIQNQSKFPFLGYQLKNK